MGPIVVIEVNTPKIIADPLVAPPPAPWQRPSARHAAAGTAGLENCSSRPYRPQSRATDAQRVEGEVTLCELERTVMDKIIV